MISVAETISEERTQRGTPIGAELHAGLMSFCREHLGDDKCEGRTLRQIFDLYQGELPHHVNQFVTLVVFFGEDGHPHNLGYRDGYRTAPKYRGHRYHDAQRSMYDAGYNSGRDDDRADGNRIQW